MPETMESARRWSGYVCPDCRFVFRVPRDHDGQGVVCPSCRRMLKIPVAGDTPPPLVVVPAAASGADEGGAGLAVGAALENVRRRRQGGGRKQTGAEDLRWENQQRRSTGLGQVQARLMIIGGGFLFALITGAVIYAFRATPAPAPIAVSSPGPKAEESAAKPESLGLRGESEVVLSAQAEPLARRWMEATRVEDLLALVHRPDRVEPKLRGLYPDGRVPAPGMANFRASDSVKEGNHLLRCIASTASHEDRVIYFVITQDKLEVDWESWAGWSEMPWERFVAEKPEAPKLFRVTLQKADYYNFAFTDDIKWQSYLLESPDQQFSLYGYVVKDSDLDNQLRLEPDVTSKPFTLMLKFPPQSAPSSKQVIIDRMVAGSWVEAEAP